MEPPCIPRRTTITARPLVALVVHTVVHTMVVPAI